MIGTFVNVGAILLGSVLGILIKKRIPERVTDTLLKGMALCVILVGISGAIKFNSLILIVISIAIGGIIGEIIDFDRHLNNLGDKAQKRFSKNDKNSTFSEAFVTSSLLFAVGSMAIIGSLQDSLGNHETLFTKAMIDGITALSLSASLGIGVAFSSVIILVYQGVMTLGASFLTPLLTDAVLNDMTAAGSLLILATGLNMLKITKIKVVNYIVAMFIPLIWFLIKKLIALI